MKLARQLCVAFEGRDEGSAVVGVHDAPRRVTPVEAERVGEVRVTSPHEPGSVGGDFIPTELRNARTGRQADDASVDDPEPAFAVVDAQDEGYADVSPDEVN